MIKKLKKLPSPTKACRAINGWMDGWMDGWIDR
jgi:hypothetical protein